MESHVYVSASISDSLYLYRNGFFSLSFSPPRLLSAHGCIFLPLLPLALIVPVQPNQAHSTIRVSLSFLFFSSLFLSFSVTFRSFSVQLASILSDTFVVSRTQSPTSPVLPSSLPFRPLVLISVLGRRACTHAAYLRRSPVYTRELSLSLSRAATNTDTACARERHGEKQGG